MPVYWARRKRGLGEAEIPLRLGVPKAGGVPSAFNGFGWRGLGMSKGFEGEDIGVDDSEQVHQTMVVHKASVGDAADSGVIGRFVSVNSNMLRACLHFAAVLSTLLYAPTTRGKRRSPRCR